MDISLILPYAAQLPHLNTAFNDVLAVPAQERPAWAKRQRATIYRDGWFVNTPVGMNGDGENLTQHVDHLQSLVDTYFPANCRALAKNYADVHDDQEVIAHAVIGGIKRDLNPAFNTQSYSLSNDDKEAIEMLAVNVLFEKDPASKSLWHDYKESTAAAAVLFRGLDKICVMWKCVEFIESGKYSHGDFQAYWDYWTPEKAEAKLPRLVSDAYIQDLLPKADALRIK